MRPKQLKLILLVALVITSCQTRHHSQNSSLIQSMEDTYNSVTTNAKSFEGQQKSTLLKVWGTPQSVFSDGQDGEVYRYIQAVTLSGGVFTLSTSMYINKDGKIYYSSVKRLYTPY